MELDCKQIIIKWFEFNLDSQGAFQFGNHSVALECPDFGFNYTGKYYSPTTYDRKFRLLREEFKIKKEESMIYQDKLFIELNTEIKSHENIYVIRRIKIGEVH